MTKQYQHNAVVRYTNKIVKTILILFALGIFCTSCTSTAEPIQNRPEYVSPAPRPAPSGQFTNLPWVDFNIKAFDKDGVERLGMQVHTEFEVFYLDNTECLALVFFEFASGEKLKDYDGEYRLGDAPGAYVRFTPGYEDTTYSDLIIFMPYDQLHLASGDHEMRLYVSLIDNTTGDKIASSDYFYFSMTVP